MAIIDWFLTSGSRVEKVFVRDNYNVIVADLVDGSGDTYTINMKRDSDSQLFVGEYIKKNGGVKGFCNGIVCFYGEQFVLFGKWREDGSWYDWVMSNIDL